MGWQEQIAQNAERYRQLQQHLSQVAITEMSRDGSIKVTVSADGLVTDLVLKERWRQPPLPQLAAEIIECLSRAQARIPDLVQKAMVEIVGTQDAGAHLVLSDARDKFPEPPPRDPVRDDDLRNGHEPKAEAPAAAPRPRTRPERVDEDDWDGRTVMEEDTPDI